jgi:winged helix-turn helix protein
MTTIVQLPRSVRRRLQHLVRKTREVGLRTRALIMLHAAAGKGTAQIADAVGYHPSAVLKVVHRFVAEGEAGLQDHRQTTGTPRSMTPCGGRSSPWYTTRPKTTAGRGRPGPKNCWRANWRKTPACG